MYLQPLQHYVDTYDQETVFLCRERESRHYKACMDGFNEGEDRGWGSLVYRLAIYFDVEMFAGERWEQKSKTIEEWMARDRGRDTLLEDAEPPMGIRCLTCRSPMEVIAKELNDIGTDDKEKVLFFFECPRKCLPRRAFFHTGEELRLDHPRCPHCKIELAQQVNRQEGNLQIVETCRMCNYSETTNFDLKPKHSEPDPHFAKDRERYCLTEEKGKEYLERKAREYCQRVESESKESEKERKRIADQIAKIEKLTFLQLEQRLLPILEAAHFGRFNLNAPERGRIFVVPFTVLDVSGKRSDREAQKELDHLLRETLAITNWRLMSTGVWIEHGVFVGRLRGHEQQHELLDLVAGKKTKGKISV